MILNAHILDGIKEFESKSVQMCMTSPPYFGLRNYRASFKWKDGWVGELGSEPTSDVFLVHLIEVFDEIGRVLKDDGVLFVNLGDTFCDKREGNIKERSLMMIPERFANSMVRRGWILRQKIVWAKELFDLDEREMEGSAMPTSKQSGLQPSWENIFMFAKKTGYKFRVDRVKQPHKPQSLARYARYLNLADRTGSPYTLDNKYNKETADRRKHGNSGLYEGRASGVMKHAEALREAGYVVKGKWYPNQMEYRKSLAESKGVDISRQFSKEKRQQESETPRADVKPRSEEKPAEAKGRNIPDVWRVNTYPYSGAHFATYPPALVVIPVLVASDPGDVVFDPFLGSGTTAMVANALRRKYAGIEGNGNSFALAKGRINNMSEVEYTRNYVKENYPDAHKELFPDAYLQQSMTGL